ncbi:MAG: hypothetical protein ABW321_15255 [Polyangiales bacterium]
MGSRIALLVGCCLLLSLGCGDDDAPPATVPPPNNRDSGAADSGGQGPADTGTADSGQPDTGTPAADGGQDSGSPDAGLDSGFFPVDSGPGDVGIDAGPPPSAWKCAEALWADGYCDCGCGVADFDCTGQSCIEPGCIQDSCDACYTTEYAWKPCAPEPSPSAWTCTMEEQLDSVCDCGCGIPDPACGGSGCSEAGCWRKKCNVRHAADGSALTDSFPPSNGWTCPADAWGGSDGCDCGCGAPDPDCQSDQMCTSPLCNAAECKTCHDKTGRIVQCANVLRNDWKCDARHYGSGDGCDCGCGADDPDCPGGKGCTTWGCRDTTCVRCTDTNYADGMSVGCAESDTWTCHLGHYGTGDGCDCGCGVKDPDCARNAGCTEPGCQQDACAYCHAGSPQPVADNDYQICDPPGDAKGWTCGSATDPAWANAECDCGCGRPDPFCRLRQRESCTEPGCTLATCEFCNTTDGERGGCDGPSWSTDGTCNTVNYGQDGDCDCGCGAIDPDCADGDGCAETLCAATGCEVCHGPGTLLATCYEWVCPAAAYGDGEICDCGCGAPDPDCSNFGCIEPGCRDSMCSPEGCHDPFGRTVRCP